MDTTSIPVTVDAFMQELQTIQSAGHKKIAILGTRHISLTHQQLIEMLAYALSLTGNTIITSGAAGTNSAVIKGVQRANPGNLQVILPQTLTQQSAESQELLQVVREHSERRLLTLAQASQMCNQEIIDTCQQLICFLYHSSTTLQESVRYAQEKHKVVTTFYLD
ncbi:MAG: DNA recombination-mediator protein A [Candidatus Sericytochromatia bacterium]|uniref:DNA recombination-mediator protein A n=1 Tax=Candidatus Tanganyikabacteria bacterium TaxID=2961651 RepID=A0A938BHT9_9BACT|nr:DNA recombination-mediator protein A [Candidatus Tanganyikabacteria bacterium]